MTVYQRLWWRRAGVLALLALMEDASVRMKYARDDSVGTSPGAESFAGPKHEWQLSQPESPELTPQWRHNWTAIEPAVMSHKRVLLDRSVRTQTPSR